MEWQAMQFHSTCMMLDWPRSRRRCLRLSVFTCMPEPRAVSRVGRNSSWSVHASGTWRVELNLSDYVVYQALAGCLP